MLTRCGSCIITKRTIYTTSRRASIAAGGVFDSDRFKLRFTQTLGALRAELGFRIIGYVLMPEHCRLVIWPGHLADPSQIMQKLAERKANFEGALISVGG
ncbi:MAG: hypothetical protein ACRD11_01990 [Terriglobia bacterium]